MLTKDLKIEIFLIILAIAGTVVGYLCGKSDGYDNGYKAGYDKGYAEAIESVKPVKPKEDTVTVGTTIKTEASTTVRPKTSTDTAEVVVNTAPPVVHATVNGQKYDFKPQHEVLETGIQTTGVINVKVPERKYNFGIGYSRDKKVAYMLKVPVKNAVGLWVAGTGRKNIMGGVSVSF